MKPSALGKTYENGEPIARQARQEQPISAAEEEVSALRAERDDLMGRLTERSEEALRTTADELLPGLSTTTAVEVGRAADTIVHLADPERFDLVVMSTRGLSAIKHLLLGSVAESVLRRCKVPLLTVCGE